MTKGSGISRKRKINGDVSRKEKRPPQKVREATKQDPPLHPSLGRNENVSGTGRPASSETGRGISGRQAHWRCLYGPVASRRLGYSLGVDILPRGTKTCTLDCIYCQLGPSPRTVARRGEYVPVRQVLAQIRTMLKSGRRIDYITFSGSGEPTLHRSLGTIIRGIKRMTPIPVAVLTNATLLHRKDVRDDLLAADLVVPSFDAATGPLFEKVNRPHSSLRLDRMFEGLRKFRDEYRGTIWLEVMLVKGVNDSPTHIRRIRQAIEALRPDKVHLNTPVRPPAEPWARPLSPEEMEKARRDFDDPRVEVAPDFRKTEERGAAEEAVTAGMEGAILEIVRRRPVTLDDIAAGLAVHRNEVLKSLEALLGRGAIRRVDHDGMAYYEPCVR